MKRRKPPRDAAKKRPPGPRPWQGVRPGQVARAKELARDPQYPSKSILKSVADLLAEKLAPPDWPPER